MKRPSKANYPGLAHAGIPAASDAQLYERIGRRIAQARDEKRLKQDQLGEMIEESAITISRWENATRKPNVEDLDKLARALGRDVAYFVEEDPKEIENEELRQLNRSLEQLSPEDQQEILAIVQIKLTRQRNALARQRVERQP